MDLSAKPKRPPFLNKKTDVSVAILIGFCHTSSHLYHLSRTCSEKKDKEDEDAIGLPPNQSATLGVAQKLHLVSHRFHFTIEAKQVSVNLATFGLNG